MDDSEDLPEVTVPLEFGKPKYQATIPEKARRVLGVNNITDDEKVIVSADITLKKVYSKE
jgi:bifunctional DNA-binding transcriptional regulator/antitoxin component of YhaV-PrlF toxin-antitoxin module